MKRAAVISAVLLMCAACGSDNNPDGPSNVNTGPIVFRANLAASNEVPPFQNAESNATGTATITMNVTRDPANGNITGGGTIDFSVQVANFPNGTQMTAAHIHPGAAGVSGGVRLSTGLSAADNVVATNGSVSFTKNGVPVNQTDATEFANNPAGFYFNVHTVLNGGGAVRGQLARQ